MGVKAYDEYRESLRDGCEVYYESQPLDSTTTHPIPGISIAYVNINYRMGEDLKHLDLANHNTSIGPRKAACTLKKPSGGEDFLKCREYEIDRFVDLAQQAEYLIED